MPNYLHTIILYMIKKFQGERSIYAMYHMLQGKKSSQTIQDAHLFGLTNIFGAVPSFTRLQLHTIIETLVTKKWIQVHGKTDVFMISQEGENQLAATLPIPTRLNGWKYQNITRVFWGRLNLLIQTLSAIIHNEMRFYPIERHPKIQQAIKQFLQKNKQSREGISAQLYEELVEILDIQSVVHQNIFVRKLTGENRIGDTFDQMAKTMELDEWYVRLLFLECLHVMIEEVEGDSKRYVLLAALIGDLHQPHLTQSTQMTLQYVNEGRSLMEIANIRRLKVHTIEDHLVEIVLADKQFSIDEYVPDLVEKKIRRAD